MGWFSSKPQQTDVELLKERSGNIIEVFTKTAEDLKVVNQEIEVARKEKLELIKQLEGETKELTETAAKNSSIVDKIEKLLA